MSQTHRFESGVLKSKEIQTLIVMLHNNIMPEEEGLLLVVEEWLVADFVLGARDNFNSIRIQNQISLY
jgi:hypothetical protein